MAKVLRAIITGKPASGKGTISKRIIANFDVVHISPGDILRLNIMNDTELGRAAKKWIYQGKLVPDEIILDSILGRLAAIRNKSWLLDGFPRTLVQAQRLDEQEHINAVINLDVPDEVIIERVKSRWIHLPSGRVYNIGFNDPKVPRKDDVTGEDLVQRPDDEPKIVAKRLEVYAEIMKPVLAFYQAKGLLTNFKGKQTSEIWPHVEEFLKDKTEVKLKNQNG